MFLPFVLLVGLHLASEGGSRLGHVPQSAIDACRAVGDAAASLGQVLRVVLLSPCQESAPARRDLGSAGVVPADGAGPSALVPGGAFGRTSRCWLAVQESWAKPVPLR